MTIENPTHQFDQDELALLEQARTASDADDQAALAAAEAGSEGTPAPAPAPVAAPAAPTPPAQAVAAAPTPAAPAAAPAAPAAPAAAPADADKGEGSTRAALRASRANEKRLKDELAESNRLIEEARRKGLIPDATGALTVKPLSDEVRKDVKAYAPEAAEYIAQLEATTVEQARKIEASPAAAPAAEFVPESLPAPIQAVVDDMPDLLAWQHNPDQTAFEAAGRMNEFLLTVPKWKAATPAERFAEVVARVKRDMGEASPPPPPPPDPLTRAREVIASAPVAGVPLTAGAIRGGSSPDSELPDYNRMLKEGMSDEELIQRLG